MKLDLFDYHLPPELVAQYPPKRRGESRLFVWNRATRLGNHTAFRSIPDFLDEGDVLVVNNTKVFKARLWGHRITGGKVELFLVRHHASDATHGELWETLVSPTRRVKEGEKIYLDDSVYVTCEKFLHDGTWLVRFDSHSLRQKIVRQFGHMPLPPYIRRADSPSDLRRYQTVFADRSHEGAVAAPTAGLHFTRSLMEKIREKGIEIVELTLHVGPGTFKPISVENIEDHVVDPEFAELSADAANVLNSARSSGGKVIAVGTTSVRTLESAPIAQGRVQPFSGMVNLYIQPGYRFKIVDHLVTNFHLPKSSLLVLVSALVGQERLMALYQEAVRQQYRFYSYGDAMLIL